ncbi:MAG: glycoside hydrolase family 2 protein, partial [Planctomycetota bacterium]|nr:glycoside hydrolase family 2 protein [Planctomycetota bacterium]
PDDCFPTRVDEARYRRRLEQAVAANMNMLRVWGGGIFETDTFYELCSEMGIMVWQDFLFACAAYPEEEPIRSLVEAEARHNIVRLAKHPSLVIWNGCNENIWGYFDWNWKPKLENRTWGLGYYLDLLPKLVRELDPTRSFWPGSPFSGSMDVHPLDDRHGNKHIWDVWFGKDYAAYRNHRPRFCSEFGFQGPPTHATLKHSMPARELRPDSKSMLHHQKMNGGNERIHERLAEHFDVPRDFSAWHYVMQLNQARALQTGVEWFRSRQPVCMGTLYWQINDCWPVVSWAAVDGEGRLKPLWYATRRFFADRLLTIQPLQPPHKLGEHLMLHAINDNDGPWRGEARIDLLRFDGHAEGLSRGHADFDVRPRSVGTAVLYGVPFGSPRDPANEFLVATLGEQRAWWFFAIDKNLAYPEPRYDAEVSQVGAQWRVKVTAHTLLRDLALFPDRLDPTAVVNEQLITLLPGESFTFEFASAKRLSRKELTAPPVLQCANRFGKRAT